MKKPAQVYPERASRNNPGGFLLSHAVARAVPSAPRGLTSVFGMGTGVALSTQPPENLERFQPADLKTRTLGFVLWPLCACLSLNYSTGRRQKKDPRSKFKDLIFFGSGGLGSQRAIARTTERPKSALRKSYENLRNEISKL
jgi:hypothetical protein